MLDAVRTPRRRSRWFSLCCALFACVFFMPSAEAEDSNFVAVLNIAGAEGGNLTPSTLQLVSDEARDAVRVALPKATIITSDTTEAILRDLGTSQSACLEGADCALDIFREMQAEIGLSGAITMLGDSFWVAWNAYDVATGKLVGRGRVTVDGEAELPDASREAATKAVDDLTDRFGGGTSARAVDESSNRGVSDTGSAGREDSSQSVDRRNYSEPSRSRSGGGGAFWRVVGEVIGGMLGIRTAPRGPNRRGPAARAPSRGRPSGPPAARGGGGSAGVKGRVLCVERSCPSCKGEPAGSACWKRWEQCAKNCGCSGASRTHNVGAACN